MNRPILVTGKMGSGKSVVAKILMNKYGFVKYSMAGWIKNTIAKHYNVESISKNMSFNDISARTYMQKLGNYMRMIDKNWHVDECINIINENKHQDKFIIDDVRFDNEISQLKKFNPVIIKIQCDEKIRLERLILRDMYVPTESELNDISEIHIDDLEYDIAIGNNSTELSLMNDVIEAYEQVRRI